VFGSGYENTVLSRMTERNMLLLDEILGKDVEKKLKTNEDYFKSIIKPQNFRDENSIELKYDRDFEKTNNILSTHTSRDVTMMTVKEYFGLVNFIQKD